MKPQAEIKIAIVVSRFNQNVTDKLLAGAKKRLQECGLEEGAITIIHVPGAVEIPLTVQALLLNQPFSAVIALGAVIQGETDHYDYVCQQVSYGCQKVALQYHTPVIFGVLTTQTEEQALARAGGSEGNKGSDSVDAAMAMIQVLQSLSTTKRVHPVDAYR